MPTAKQSFMADASTGEVLEVTPDWMDGVKELQPEPATELTWWTALCDGALLWDATSGAYARLSREQTHERLALLEQRLLKSETLLPEVERQLAELDAIVAANDDRLMAAAHAVQQLVWDAAERDQQAARDAGRILARPPMWIAADLWLGTLGCRLDETKEWQEQHELHRRINVDKHTPEGRAVQRRTEVQAQVTTEQRLRGQLQNRIADLRDNLAWHDDQDARRDPNSAQSRAHQQLVDRLDADVAAGKILTYRFTG